MTELAIELAGAVAALTTILVGGYYLYLESQRRSRVHVEVFKHELRLPPDLQGALEAAGQEASSDLFTEQIEQLISKNAESWIADRAQIEHRTFKTLQEFANVSRWRYSSSQSFFYRIIIKNHGQLQANNISLRVEHAFYILKNDCSTGWGGDSAHIDSLRPGEEVEFDAWTKDIFIFNEAVRVFMDGGSPIVRIHENGYRRGERAHWLFAISARLSNYFVWTFVLVYLALSFSNIVFG
ncbi:hypothetical protein [Thioalkalivibrio sp. ALMg13-2]|uniref:hypothetical protein n=1 Tax=Thioalkalivibrio sp. ALMg13-2 TaxID=1158167 RepID=UPI0012DD32AF|nr:hypothetical protein [Thioalkalivibrio sp. ALMg13-2]